MCLSAFLFPCLSIPPSVPVSHSLSQSLQIPLSRSLLSLHPFAFETRSIHPLPPCSHARPSFRSSSSRPRSYTRAARLLNYALFLLSRRLVSHATSWQGNQNPRYDNTTQRAQGWILGLVLSSARPMCRFLRPRHDLWGGTSILTFASNHLQGDEFRV